MLGVQGGGYPQKGTWQSSFGWRYQESDKHYVGDVYQVQRTEEGSQVINHINLADLTLKYQATDRIELGFGLPYFMGTRSQALRGANRVIIDRYQTQARNIGDVVFGARRWMLDPSKHASSNIQLGLGVKLPTGEANVTDTFKTFSATPAPNGTVSTAIRTVDQSIQPGDGGFGLLADLYAFKSLAKGKFALYLNGTYLSEPAELSGVQTYRGANEEIMSNADSYLMRAGTTVGVPGIKSLAFSIGGRWEGVPAHDLIGGSLGFRRPGYAISIEPSLSWVKGKNGISLGVPFAVYRNRTVSVPDEINGTHGDAAFADYLILFGYSRRF